VFKSTEGAPLTDADIDVLLTQGEERTKAASEKLKKDMAKLVGTTVTLEDLLKTGDSSVLYEDPDSVGAWGSSGPGLIVPLPEREKKISGCVAAACLGPNPCSAFARPVPPLTRAPCPPPLDRYNEKEAAAASFQGANKGGRAAGPKLNRLPPMADYQFYNKARLEALVAKENELLLKRRDLARVVAEKKSKESAERRVFIRARVKELANRGGEGEEGEEEMGEGAAAGGGGSGGGASAAAAAAPGDGGFLTATEAEAQAEREWRAREEGGALESSALEAELRDAEFPEADRLEKERLLAEGFPGWNKRDQRVYINACERHGRANVDAIVAEVADGAEKAPEEVRRYHRVMWERYGELADGAKLLEKIERGEIKLKKNKATEAVIAEKVARSPDPFRTLHVPYGADKRAMQRGYTEEEDRFLICMLNVLGYGAWDALKAEIRRAEVFRFDFFIKSRSAGDLSRRADTLIRLLEKEAVDSGTAAGKEIMAAGGPKLGRGRAAGKEGRDAPEGGAEGAKKKRKRAGGEAEGRGKKAAKGAAAGAAAGGDAAPAAGGEDGAEGVQEGEEDE
jgi:hypothetical protein